MSQEKPWKSFDEQLSILKGRGLQIDDEAAALSYLERLGYYRLSGYLYPFRAFEITKDAQGKLAGTRCVDHFMEGSHFEDAVNLYVFDKKLRMLALDALERIEMSVRVDVAHLLGEKDIHAHEVPAIFFQDFTSKVLPGSGKTGHQEWLASYQKNLERSRRVEFVKHYLDKYGRLPIWVSTEIWDFGMLSKLFAGMYRADQNIIAAKYGASDGPDFSGWLRGLNFVRNVSAHHNRLWNGNMLEYLTPIQGRYWNQLKPERPFFYFCIMQRLMRIICPNSSWAERFARLVREFPDLHCKAVSPYDMGLIEDWESWELWGLK
ncbi:MAG: abortive phage resistance protein [Zetaproteobacteria bacterium CG06_land_8_20_14_3_00_59_53]|nr:MAG: abortive phage resistance protein [Zetaproteobacteria bacterium CG2_30_59_37]PIO89194.1 MAG: abortive phage resistance protein [Zetaproteobacteria bacterium CG23_combo_of_CG06-09_8_20_14_all_59_86]PIQ64953.1 MAG: abortive phage resistance protein [Zetaproteobacteria bacterium CG11_big_fil_rev_8_21_14_0_20_59_439]PIU71039.1 MAG: abortive phage resistance protein [Zetaproteobacteria bacterium CG06_land_8_20_14_3_00_59_53]PIU97930.1 MAG: abortive phage resistance protein [Zetaproteobacteri